jgi:arylformamidase
MPQSCHRPAFAEEAHWRKHAAVKASAKLLAHWTPRSARFRERHRGHLGLVYGEQPRERLDLFLAGNPAAPTLAYIHGGYWQMTHQTKEMYSALAEGAVSHGLNVAVVEYTLAPEARMDRIVGEVHHAISWLHEHLGDYGADPGRIYLAGHSAGGHLAAMTMPLGAVRGGIAISGVYDLEPVRLNYPRLRRGSANGGNRAQRKHVTLPTDFRFPLRKRSFRTTAVGRQGLALQLPSNKSCK